MLQTLQGHRRALVAVLFLLLAAVGLWMLPQRTAGWDESSETHILTVNIKAYVDLLLPETSPTRQALAGEEEIGSFIERDHGQAQSYWVWPLMQRAESRAQSQAIYHYHIYLTFLLGLYAMYRIVWRLTGSWQWGLVGLGLLCCNPRFFAEAFYNNKDIMLLSLCLVVFWLAQRFAEGDDWASCVWFGIAGAFATNTRMIGLGAFGLAGLFYIAWVTARRGWSRRALVRGAAAVAVWLGVFYLITPAAWGNFFGFWQYYLGASSNFDAARWNEWVLYRGAVYNPTENPIPWHYIPWLMAITTPLLVLALAAAWPVLAVVRCRRGREPWCSFELLYGGALCLFAGLPLLYAMAVRPNLYNGWRHLYFIYLTVVVLAAVSAFWLWQARARWARPLVGAALALNLVYYAGFIGVNFPNEYAYFNLLAGPHPEERYDADYWAISLPGVIEDVLTLDEDARVVDVGTRALLRQRWYMVKEEKPELFGEKAEELTWDRRWRGKYVLENTSYWAIERLHNNWDEATAAQMQQWQAELAQAPVLYEAKCGGTVLWRLYANPEYRP